MNAAQQSGGGADDTCVRTVTLHGAHRYRLLRELGEGAQGSVFEAEVAENGRRVAVKILRQLGREALSRFKREFRIRQQIDHPALVEFGELAQDESNWFFTMELIRGVPLLDYLRTVDSESRFRSCFAQLASAIATLHAAELFHRDIKSENILVEDSGRVVLLDLGLAVTATTHATTAVAGTPRYMAPEQWSGTPASASADWYAFGVLLFEALSGQPPFAGSPLELFMAKTEHDAPRVREASTEAPPDLAELCDRLLQRNPAQRAGVAEVQRCFGEVASEFAPRRRASALVGRREPLAQLQQALDDARRGRAVLVLVEGESGVGKTALASDFLAQAAAQEVQWRFFGRCYERELVPFNAFDEALEGIAKQLRHREARSSLEHLRPRHPGLLARVFPVLSFLGAGRVRDSWIPPDPSEIKVRALTSLYELLARMADESPVILCIDDAHWADSDSLELLARLHKADFPLLLVLLVRPDAEVARLKLETRHVIELAPLNATATKQLALQLAPALGACAASVFEDLHASTSGNPLLVCEWARFVQTHGVPPEHAFRDVLKARIDELPERRRELLTLVSVAGAPLERDLASALTGADAVADVAALTRDHLLRTLEREGTAYLDVYHDRIRQTINQLVDRAEQLRMHGEVARSLEGRGAPPERRIAHELATNAKERAAVLAIEGARLADQGLAFRRAAEMYELAAELGALSAANELELRMHAARAWENAHCPMRAADALLAASRLCSDERERRGLERRAGEQTLLGGHLNQGFATLEPAMAEHGLALAATPTEALGWSLMALQDLLQRGLGPAQTPQVWANGADRVALCLSLSQCLLHVDLRGLPFTIHALRVALDLPDKTLLQRALAGFVMVTAGHLPNPLIEPAFELCRSLTGESSDAYAQAICALAEAELQHFRGRYADAELACERAEQILLERCVAVTRELGHVRSLALIMAHADKGDYRAHVERALQWLEDARLRGDGFTLSWLRAAQSLAWMARDEPDRAQRELDDAEREWPAGLGGTFETACVLHRDAIDRYQNVPGVEDRPAQGRRSVLESPVTQSPLLQGYLHLQTAWGCLRTLGTSTEADAAKDAVRERVVHAIASMRGLQLANWTSVAEALEANLLFLNGQRAQALALLDRAQGGLTAVHMPALAACAKRRRGEMAGGEIGARWVGEADADLERLGVRAPARFARAYFSPFSLERG